MNKLIISAIVAAAFAMPGVVQAKTYTCWNPAICKAVCGKTTCGEALASSAQSQDQAAKQKQTVRAR
jgi:hypothetical protein